MEQNSGKKDIQRKIASILLMFGFVALFSWGIFAYLLYFSIITINPAMELIGLILAWAFIITLFVGLILHPESRETIRMANKETATKLKKYLRIFLIIVLVFLVILAFLILLGVFTDWVIIETE